ncbi:MAG TPA: helical backbone metal receptor [Polyangiaceae bacterium]|jgi:ABC-type Fe3+-hydroxamate transport system substrate-binding protein|nr:helical backbone metal receptor [Polyangiaceae bacterium]
MGPSRRVIDDRRRVLEIALPPSRVVSLVPSDTFNVAALGCAGALVGRTDYCDLPAEVVAAVPSVGGTKNPRIEDIVALEPDLVLANQEENSRSDLEGLAQRGVRVYVAFPRRVADGLAHLARLARLFGVEAVPAVRALLKRGYDEVRAADQARRAPSGSEPVRTFCPIWMDPLMTIHGDTFISDMLDLCGASNVFADRPRRYPLAADLGRAAPLPPARVAGRDVRYPRVTLEEVVARAPELVLLPDEPHPFTEADAGVFRALPIPAAGRGAVVPMSGKDLCWYGAQSIEGIARVRALVAGFTSPR